MSIQGITGALTDAPKTRQDAPRRPKTHPRRAKTLPRRSQDAPRRPRDDPKTAPRRVNTRPRCAEDAPKTPQGTPRHPKAPPRRPQYAPRRPRDVCNAPNHREFLDSGSLLGTPKRPNNMKKLTPKFGKKKKERLSRKHFLRVWVDFPPNLDDKIHQHRLKIDAKTLSIFDAIVGSILDRFLLPTSTPGPSKYWFFQEKQRFLTPVLKLTSVIGAILVPTWFHFGSHHPAKSIQKLNPRGIKFLIDLGIDLFTIFGSILGSKLGPCWPLVRSIMD